MTGPTRPLAGFATWRVPVPYVLIGLAAISYPSWWPVVTAWSRHGSSNPDKHPRQIHEIVREVKEELAAADSERIARGEAPLFLLGYFDLDLKFTVTKSDKTHGEASPMFVVVGSEEDVGHERVQEVHLHFVAVPDSERQTAARIDTTSHSANKRIIDLDAPPPSEK